MDTIRIHQLEFQTRIGVPDSERAMPQRVLVSIEMSVDTSHAAKTDDVSKSIDYQRVAEEIAALAETERKTIERLAEDIAAMILEKFQPESVQVTIEKFPLPRAKSVSISITRKR